MANHKNYLLLDKDDITKVCGVVSSKEILKELTHSQIISCLNNGKLFRNKYILRMNEKRKTKHSRMLNFMNQKQDTFMLLGMENFLQLIRKQERNVLLKNIYIMDLQL